MKSGDDQVPKDQIEADPNRLRSEHIPSVGRTIPLRIRGSVPFKVVDLQGTTITEGAAQKLIEKFNEDFPEFRHWKDDVMNEQSQVATIPDVDFEWIVMRQQSHGRWTVHQRLPNTTSESVVMDKAIKVAQRFTARVTVLSGDEIGVHRCWAFDERGGLI